MSIWRPLKIWHQGLQCSLIFSQCHCRICSDGVYDGTAESEKTVPYDGKKEITPCGTARTQELRDQTIGIIGTGRIGMESLKLFSAFTRDILLYDPYPKEEAKAMGTYVSQDEIYEKSTLLVFHCPFTKKISIW